MRSTEVLGATHHRRRALRTTVDGPAPSSRVPDAELPSFPLHGSAITEPDTEPRPGIDLPDLARQAGRLLLHVPRLARGPRGTGRPVILVPGWTTPDLVLLPMRGFLRARGHDARGWGLGPNQGTDQQKADLLALVERTAAGHGGPVDLVGWSLGGTLARHVVHRRPEVVASLTTIATPLSVYGSAISPTAPVGPPIRTIVTPHDQVVAIADQRDPASRVDVVEARISHVGSLLAPEVWLAVADWLHRHAEVGAHARTAG